MNNVLITTRGTNNKYKFLKATETAFSMLLGLAALVIYFSLKGRKSEDEAVILLIGGIFFIANSLFEAIKGVGTSTYVDIYQDHITGKYVESFKLLDFSIKSEQIVNVTVNKRWVHIHTNNNIYKIMTDKETAKKIFGYYRK